MRGVSFSESLQRAGPPLPFLAELKTKGAHCRGPSSTAIETARRDTHRVSQHQHRPAAHSTRIRTPGRVTMATSSIPQHPQGHGPMPPGRESISILRNETNTLPFLHELTTKRHRVGSEQQQQQAHVEEDHPRHVRREGGSIWGVSDPLFDNDPLVDLSDPTWSTASLEYNPKRTLWRQSQRFYWHAALLFGAATLCLWVGALLFTFFVLVLVY